MNTQSCSLSRLTLRKSYFAALSSTIKCAFFENNVLLVTIQAKDVIVEGS